MELGPLSVEAATTLAQVIPALLVAGILGPLIVGTRPEYPERKFYAGQVVAAVIAEGICLVSVVTQQAVPALFTFVILTGVFYSLLGILTFPAVWARKTASERTQIAESKAKRRALADVRKERRAARRAARVSGGSD